MLLLPPTLVILFTTTLALASASAAAATTTTTTNNLQKSLQLTKFSEAQQILIERYPGSLIAVARALKMTIVECQYQMRHEPWNCPVFGFSTKPSEMFGNLMSRNFKETSFIHALLSAAITHSIARACTESIITTCGSRKSRDGDYAEDIKFGLQFAKDFMEATHEFNTNSAVASTATTTYSLVNNAAAATTLNSEGSADGSNNNEVMVQPHHQHQLTSGGSNQMMKPTSGKERKIRNLINAHNYETGRLYVYNGMRRECKCHGLSAQCTMETCWKSLPPFREVASKLHDRLDQAVRFSEIADSPTKYKLLTSGSSSTMIMSQPQPQQQQQQQQQSVKKSNKKRSSMPKAVDQHIINAPAGLSVERLSPRSSTFSKSPSPPLSPARERYQRHMISYPPLEASSSNSLTSDSSGGGAKDASSSNVAAAAAAAPSGRLSSGSKRANTGRGRVVQQQQQQVENQADNCVDCYRTPVGIADSIDGGSGGGIGGVGTTQGFGAGAGAAQSVHTTQKYADIGAASLPILKAASLPSTQSEANSTTNFGSPTFDSLSSSGGGGGGGGGGEQTTADSSSSSSSSSGGNSWNSLGGSHSAIAQTTSISSISREQQHTHNATLASNIAVVLKKRPVARSIGTHSYRMALDKFDLIYYESSPDFCIPNYSYSIKGTKGRICSENANAVNSCKTLCCDRGYKTELREDKYKCECQFKFCCELICKICTRRKVIHRCL